MIDFDVLLKQQNKENPHRILCLDPGHTMGWSIIKHTGETTLIEEASQVVLVENDKINWARLYTFYQDHNDVDAIIMEDYRIYEHKLTRHTFSPVFTLRIIGAIELLAACDGYLCKGEMPVNFQMAMQAKGFVTDDKLKAWGFWQEGQKHARDSIRHGLYWLLFDKERRFRR